MNLDLELPWQRYGLIVELAERMKKHGHSFGKTALQKLIFFLQELHGVDCGYEFTLYTYGPFSSQLLSDLDSVAMFDGVDVKYNGVGGYQISPGSESRSLRQHAAPFVKKYNTAIEGVVTEFGGAWAKSLELLATIVYVERDAKAGNVRLTIEQIAGIVHDLKPHFPMSEVRDAIEQLLQKQCIDILQPATVR